MNKLDKEKNYISVVVYVHNDEKYIKDFIIDTDKVFSKVFDNYEYVIVNDASLDNSMDIVKKIGSSISGNITIVNLSYEHGLEKAMLAGDKIAIGDFVYEIDTIRVDYDINCLVDLYKKTSEGYDIVSLSPKGKTSKLSNAFYNIVKRNSNQKMELYTQSACVISRRAINRISILDNRVEYRKAAYHYCGLPNTYIFYDPIKEIDKPKQKFEDKFNLASDVIIRYSKFASKLSFILSMAFLAFTLVTVIYVIVCYLTMADIQKGWTTTMFFLSVSFSGLFLMMSFLFRYMDILVRDKYVSSNYSFTSVEQIKNVKNDKK